MKISSTFDISVLFLVALMFSMPLVTLAQQNSGQAEAIAAATAAEADANQDVNKPLWFGAGCLLSGLTLSPLPGWYSLLIPPVGLTGSYFYQPDPPLSRLIGKSPEYVDVYTQTYKSKRGNIQALWASTGCISGCAVMGGLVFAVGVGIGLGATAVLEE